MNDNQTTTPAVLPTPAPVWTPPAMCAECQEKLARGEAAVCGCTRGSVVVS